MLVEGARIVGLGLLVHIRNKGRTYVAVACVIFWDLAQQVTKNATK